MVAVVCLRLIEGRGRGDLTISSVQESVDNKIAMCIGKDLRKISFLSLSCIFEPRIFCKSPHVMKGVLCCCYGMLCSISWKRRLSCTLRY